MDDLEGFLHWFDTTWKQAEDALHRGDAAGRTLTWSHSEPVTLFGAWFNALDPAAAHEVFFTLARSFAQKSAAEEPSGTIDLITAQVEGSMAYTLHRETTSTTVNGRPRDYTLRVTQVYRSEEGTWRVVHRHADSESGADEGP